MKKLLAFSLLLLVSHLPISCGCNDDTSCGCNENFGPPQEMLIKAFELETGVFDVSGFEQRNSTDTLAYEAAALKLEVSEVDFRNAQAGLHFSLMSGAYACSPIEPDPPAIESLLISSDQSLWVEGKEYKAGESLNSLFFIANESCGTADFCDVASFLRMQQNDPWQFGFQSDFLIFQLLQQPDSLAQQAFNIDLMLADSSTFALTSSRLIIR